MLSRDRLTLSRRALLGGLAGAAAGGPRMIALAAGTPAYRLTILHMNDFHARHEPVDAAALACARSDANPADAKPGCYGGAARLATAIATERAAAGAAGRAVLLVDAGDQFQGSLFYTAWHGEVELAVMHALGTEVMAVGNHEFDNGPQTLARFIRAARFPVVSANIDVAADPALAGLPRPFAMFDKAGLRIGVVGLTTPDTAVGSSPGPHVRFTSPAEALVRTAGQARAAGARLVIALSHLGVMEDHALAATIPGVGAFVGGHSHTLLSDSEPGAAGPAHQVIQGPAGRTVVVQAAAFGRYLGRLDLDVDVDGTVLAYGGDVRHVGLELAEEPTVRGIVAGYADQLGTVRRRVVGQTTAPFPTDGCRVGECALGVLVAEAMLASDHGADVAIMNAGGLRTGLPGGAVTVGDVLTALPFGNTVATLKLSGTDLLAAIDNGLSRAGKGAFPQIAGARLRWNPLAPADRRLVSLDIRQPDGRFIPIDPAATYRVVTNSFLRAGGDGYTVLKDRAIDPYDAGPPVDVVVSNRLSEVSPAAPVTDGRIAVP